MPINPAKTRPTTPLVIVDVIKVLASQLIVLHHFVSYGSMAKTVYPYATHMFDWLYNDGRMAVQAFLLLGGFFAARSLAPRLHQFPCALSWPALARLAWRRYIRLLRPYLIALLLAILFAAIARLLMADPDTPAAPSLRQVLFHVLLIHDIAGVDALSTGVWYVAIDFQLYCMLLLLLWGSQRIATALRVEVQTVVQALVVGLSALSLLWFNRDDAMEMWCIFYFGAYGLGIMMQWFLEEKSKFPWLAVLLLIYFLALALEWRTRLIVSILTATLLGLGLHSNYSSGGYIRKVVSWLSRISYSVFLTHYPIVLLVGTIVARLWPEDIAMSVVGFLTAWLMTLGMANVLYHRVEIVRSSR